MTQLTRALQHLATNSARKRVGVMTHMSQIVLPAAAGAVQPAVTTHHRRLVVLVIAHVCLERSPRPVAEVTATVGAHHARRPAVRLDVDDVAVQSFELFATHITHERLRAALSPRL